MDLRDLKDLKDRFRQSVPERNFVLQVLKDLKDRWVRKNL
jgi:hypothetical protein